MPQDKPETPAPKEGVTQLGLHQETPAAFQGWNKLFVKQGDEPEGWKNAAATDEGKPVPVAQTVRMISKGGTEAIDAKYREIADYMKKGYEFAAHMIAPTGEHGDIPLSRIREAEMAGFKHHGEEKK